MRRALVVGGAALIAALAVLHLPIVLRHVGHCPFGYDRAPAHHADHVAAGEVLGFTLDRSTAHDVHAWAVQHGVSCHQRRGTLTCTNVAAALIGGALPATTLWFELDRDDTIRAVRTVRRTSSATALAAGFERAAADAGRLPGVPVAASGSAAPADLAAGTLRQASLAYRGARMEAQLRATNMGDGYALTESYVAID